MKTNERAGEAGAKGRVSSTPVAAGDFKVKVGLAEMLKGGVIMDVVNAEQAKIAEEAGAAAVMALERVPAEIRRDGGVARASDPSMIQSIQAAVNIPVMAKCRIGHFMEARILEALEVDFIDESEVLTPADPELHIDKRGFRIPFVCGCRDLGEALRRITEGAAMIRTKGEAGTGDIVEAVRHLRAIRRDMRALAALGDEELAAAAKRLSAPIDLVTFVAREGRLPVPNFAAGGIATPADAALCMALGAEAVFVGSGVFLSEDPLKRARAIVTATTCFEDAKKLAEVSTGLGAAMRGLESRKARSARSLLVEGRMNPIGVLAVQGAFAAHAAALVALGLETREVRAPRDFEGLGGLVLPGGESSVQLELARRLGLVGPLAEFVASGAPILATCAGLILAARRVVSPSQPSFGFVDVAVARNAYGRQIASFETRDDANRLPLVFIRAPRIVEVARGVEVLATLSDEPVMVRQRNVTACSFHPELSGDLTVHLEVFGHARAEARVA